MQVSSFTNAKESRKKLHHQNAIHIKRFWPDAHTQTGNYLRRFSKFSFCIFNYLKRASGLAAF